MKNKILVLMLAAVFALTACSTQKKMDSDDDFSVEAEDSSGTPSEEGDLALEVDSSADTSSAASDGAESGDLDLDEGTTETSKANNSAGSQDLDSALENELDSLDSAPQAKAEATASGELSLDEPVVADNTPANAAQELTLDEPAPVPIDPIADTPPADTTQAPVPVQDQAVVQDPAPPVPELIQEPLVAPQEAALTPAPMLEQSGPPATINNVQYKGNVNGGTIAISADKPVQFTTRFNETTNQFVVEVQNSTIPKKLKRSLNTKDMASSIGSVDIYQKEGSSVARFVVQMRAGTSNPIVQQEGNSLLIIAAGAGGAQEQSVAGGAEVPQPQMSDNSQLSDSSNIAGQSPTQNNTQENTMAESQSNYAGSGSDVGASVVATDNSIVAVDTGSSKSGADPDANLVQPNSKGILTYNTLDEFLMSDTKFYGKKINLETSGMDTAEALRFLAEESGVNIILDESVMNAGKVNIKLKEVPWDQAFVLILKSKKLIYKRQGNVIRVANLEDIKKDEDEANRLKQSRVVPEPLAVKRFFVSYAEVDELKSKIDEYLTAIAAANRNNSITSSTASAFNTQTSSSSSAPTSVGKVIVDKRNNSLIITDTESNLKKIEEIVAALDIQPKQILIEAKIIEATETFSKGLGITWNAPGATAGSGSVNSGNFGITSGVTVPSTFNASVTWGQIDFIGSLSPTLLLGESQNLVKTLASPRITVLSNTAANITQSDDINVQGLVTNPQTGLPQIVPITRKAGVNLSVTPVATNQGTVNMKLTLTRNQANGVGTSDRQANTELFIKSGSTAVVGGIYLTNTVEDDDGVPVLRSIPVLGSLFESKSQTKQKSELMMFLTPTILKPL